MKRSVTACLAALFSVAACTSQPASEEPTQEVAAESSLTAEEQEAISGLAVYQRDLEALGNIYKNFNSKPVRDAVLEVRATEIIRLLGEANTRREVYDIDEQMIPDDTAAAKNAMLDKKASFMK